MNCWNRCRDSTRETKASRSPVLTVAHEEAVFARAHDYLAAASAVHGDLHTAPVILYPSPESNVHRVPVNGTDLRAVVQHVHRAVLDLVAQELLPRDLPIHPHDRLACTPLTRTIESPKPSQFNSTVLCELKSHTNHCHQGTTGSAPLLFMAVYIARCSAVIGMLAGRDLSGRLAVTWSGRLAAIGTGDWQRSVQKAGGGLPGQEARLAATRPLPSQ